MGRIVEATEDDIPVLMTLAHAMHGASDFAPIPIEDDMLRAFLKIAITEPNYCVFLGVFQDKVVGAFIGCISPFMFSTAKKANDLSLFILPEYRGSSLALRLIREYEKWAKERDAVRIYLGVSTGEDKACEFYGKIGYNNVGGLFRKETEV